MERPGQAISPWGLKQRRSTLGGNSSKGTASPLNKRLTGREGASLFTFVTLPGIWWNWLHLGYGDRRAGGNMPNFICTTCGTQYAESYPPPAACAICQDERQYVKATGQNWTTLERLRLTNRNSIKFKGSGLIGVGIEPHFAIGQRSRNGSTHV